MNRKKKLLAAVVGGLLSACALTGLTALAMEKPEYLKSVTYFGDEWPINYWSSEDKDIDANFEQIVEDGFNSIILVVPWRQFQPLDGMYIFNEPVFDRLEEVIEKAADHGLWVTIRLGYSWDYYGDTGLPDRFEKIFIKDSYERASWLTYSKKIYETVSRHENFHSAFITWEDFWDFSYTMGRDILYRSRIRKAQTCGYTDYLREHYTLSEVNERYNADFTDFSEVYIPYRDHTSATLFYEYYDHALMEILRETQEVFPGLSMEVRTDGDQVYDENAKPYYYSHNVTFPVEGADYSAMMYPVSFGQANNGNRISAETAISAMNQNMINLFGFSGKKYYVEQLLYVDSTASVAANTKLEDGQVDAYIRGIAPILKAYTMGYGIWAYRNYVNNCLYNAQFGLGTEGWAFSGNAKVEVHNGTPMACLGKDGSIYQDTVGRLQDGDRIYVRFYAEPMNESAAVTVSIGGETRRVNIPEARTYSFSVPWVENYAISMTASRGVYLDDIKVYTIVQDGQIYSVDGEATELVEAFRDLNRQLDQ